MFGTKKHKVRIWSVTISLCFFLISCNTVQRDSFEISGETQGTTYNIKVIGDDSNLAKVELDSLFSLFDLSLSTYIDESVISSLNNSMSSTTLIDSTGYFKTCYNEAYRIFENTNGAFDPSVFPLVKGWGFMNNMETPLTQKEVDSILTFVSLDKGKHHTIKFSENTIDFYKINPNFKIDFNAIAQGLSVDVVDDLLEEKGYTDYYIEIGGELIVRGMNRENVPWTIGIDSPIENATSRELENIIHVSNKAIATSGNYRKFYVADGVKYSHTLNPKTGFPVQHSLLSATVIADKCSIADGYATAFMVLGVENTFAYIKNHPEENIEVYLIYTDHHGEMQSKMSDGFSVYLK